MKKTAVPSSKQLHCAANLLDNYTRTNARSERHTCEPVIVYLRELASEKDLEIAIKNMAIENGVKPEDLTPAVMRKIKVTLVKKFGKSD